MAEQRVFNSTVARSIRAARTILFSVTGGRPMKREGPAFYDFIGHLGVSYYRDKLGRRWLAEGPWSKFRVEIDG